MLPSRSIDAHACASSMKNGKPSTHKSVSGYHKFRQHFCCAYRMSFTCCQAVFALPRRSALVAIASPCQQGFRVCPRPTAQHTKRRNERKKKSTQQSAVIAVAASVPTSAFLVVLAATIYVNEDAQHRQRVFSLGFRPVVQTTDRRQHRACPKHHPSSLLRYTHRSHKSTRTTTPTPPPYRAISPRCPAAQTPPKTPATPPPPPPPPPRRHHHRGPHRWPLPSTAPPPSRPTGRPLGRPPPPLPPPAAPRARTARTRRAAPAARPRPPAGRRRSSSSRGGPLRPTSCSRAPACVCVCFLLVSTGY